MHEIPTLQWSDFSSLLTLRARDAHKGLFGHVLIIGGGIGMAGAVRLAAEAALRVGAGLVSVATQPQHVSIVLSGRPEIMAHGITDAKELKPLLAKATVIVIGPGLGQTHWSKSLITAVLTAPQPKIVDADALNYLAKYPQRCDNWILTPHPGEAARLLHADIQTIQIDRMKAAQTLQHTYGGVVILKGCGSLICSATSLKRCIAGNPGMASGGMGDVLSGIIGGLLAQYGNMQQAAELGVYLHATAADKVAQQQGERGMLASDLMPYLIQLVNPS